MARRQCAIAVLALHGLLILVATTADAQVEMVPPETLVQCPGALLAFPVTDGTMTIQALYDDPASREWDIPDKDPDGNPTNHTGLDIYKAGWAEASGTKVYAPRNAKVSRKNTDRSFDLQLDGLDGVEMYFTHMTNIVVKLNAPVQKGQLLGEIDNVEGGRHLHISFGSPGYDDRNIKLTKNPADFFGTKNLDVRQGRAQQSKQSLTAWCKEAGSASPPAAGDPAPKPDSRPPTTTNPDESWGDRLWRPIGAQWERFQEWARTTAEEQQRKAEAWVAEQQRKAEEALAAWVAEQIQKLIAELERSLAQMCGAAFIPPLAFVAACWAGRRRRRR